MSGCSRRSSSRAARCGSTARSPMSRPRRSSSGSMPACSTSSSPPAARMRSRSSTPARPAARPAPAPATSTASTWWRCPRTRRSPRSSRAMSASIRRSIAGVENGAIVLSAGYSVVGGEPDRFADFTAGPVPDQQASFEIRGGTITLRPVRLCRHQHAGERPGHRQPRLPAGRQPVRRRPGGAVRRRQPDGHGRRQRASSRPRTSGRSTSIRSTSSAAPRSIFADGGGSVDIFGNAIVDSSAQGVVNVVTSIAGHGTGGTAGLFAERRRHRARARRHAACSRPAPAACSISRPIAAATARAASRLVEGRNGGQVQLDGTLAMDASGTGSRSNGSANPGATGTGGDAHVAAIGGGTVNVAGATALTAERHRRRSHRRRHHRRHGARRHRLARRGRHCDLRRRSRPRSPTASAAPAPPAAPPRAARSLLAATPVLGGPAPARSAPATSPARRRRRARRRPATRPANGTSAPAPAASSISPTSP